MRIPWLLVLLPLAVAPPALAQQGAVTAAPPPQPGATTPAPAPVPAPAPTVTPAPVPVVPLAPGEKNLTSFYMPSCHEAIAVYDKKPEAKPIQALQCISYVNGALDGAYFMAEAARGKKLCLPQVIETERAVRNWTSYVDLVQGASQPAVATLYASLAAAFPCK